MPGKEALDRIIDRHSATPSKKKVIPYGCRKKRLKREKGEVLPPHLEGMEGLYEEYEEYDDGFRRKIKHERLKKKGDEKYELKPKGHWCAA